MAQEHEALAVFVGDWYAEGSAFGVDGEATPSRSVHSARWHSGGYFVVQDERANGPFDTLSFLGWDPQRAAYFARSIENHGYSREYAVTVDDDPWTFTGDQERATVTFSDDGLAQTHHWEFRPEGSWIPLCDRTARRIE